MSLNEGVVGDNLSFFRSCVAVQKGDANIKIADK